MTTYTDPTGDPQGIRNASQRLTSASTALRSSADQLAGSNRDAAAAWESIAQQAFSLIAETISSVVGGSAGIADEYAAALNRYAAVLEAAQNDVRQARYRQQTLIASTPIGMMPDQNAVASLDAVVQQAHAAAYQAARELSATAMQLMGAGQPIDPSHGGADPSVSFVSQAHTLTGQVTSAHPNAAAFDAQANQIELQMAGVLATLTTLGAGNPTGNPPGVVTLPAAGIGAGLVGGSNFSDSIVTLPAAGIGGALVGGTSVSLDIAPGIVSGAGVIGGADLGNMTITDAFGNVTVKPVTSAGTWSPMTLIEAAEDIRHRSAVRVWESVFPGVPPPNTSAIGIVTQILEQADNLTPYELEAVNMIIDSNDYGIRTQLLPDGFELVRVTY